MSEILICLPAEKHESCRGLLEFVVSELSTILNSRAYSSCEIKKIMAGQRPRNRLATDIAAAAGLRAHELATLALISEQPHSMGRDWPKQLFFGMENFDEYSVVGKGGLIRTVAIPHFLSTQLEKLRLKKPRLVTDREIQYLQFYDISFGQKWSQSFTTASQSKIGFSNGAHGLRHTYTQERVRSLLRLGLSNQEARLIVSSELGHFRTKIIDFYLR